MPGKDKIPQGSKKRKRNLWVRHRGSAKPGVNWNQIRDRYRAGESPTAICRDWDITRQAIENRARVYRWLAYLPEFQEVPGGTLDTPDGEPADTPDALVGPGTPDGVSGVPPGTLPDGILDGALDDLAGKSAVSNDLLHAFIKMLRNGCTVRLACAASRIDVNTLDNWCKASRVLNRAVDQAQALFATEVVGHLLAAGRIGDWKASEALLSRHPFLKDEWAHAQARNTAGGNIQVVLNIPPPRNYAQIEYERSNKKLTIIEQGHESGEALEPAGDAS